MADKKQRFGRRLQIDDLIQPGDRLITSTPLVDFGTWKLVGTDLILKREDWRVIDLECDSSAEILDWIFHYRAKGLTAQEKADMLDAIEVILHPRKNYCSSGQDLRPSGAALVKAHRKRIRDSKGVRG